MTQKSRKFKPLFVGVFIFVQPLPLLHGLHFGIKKDIPGSAFREPSHRQIISVLCN